MKSRVDEVLPPKILEQLRDQGVFPHPEWGFVKIEIGHDRDEKKLSVSIKSVEVVLKFEVKGP